LKEFIRCTFQLVNMEATSLAGMGQKKAPEGAFF